VRKIKDVEVMAPNISYFTCNLNKIFVGGDESYYSHELHELFNEPDIVIKINSLGWAGRVMRMDNNRTVKKVFNTKPRGFTKIGRLKLRWKNDVIRDIKTLGVKYWRKLAMEKESCQKLLRKVRAHVGLSSQ
jgi:hypothetical protein